MDDLKEAKRTVRSLIDGILDLGELYASYIAVQGALSRRRVKRGGHKE